MLCEKDHVIGMHRKISFPALAVLSSALSLRLAGVGKYFRESAIRNLVVVNSQMASADESTAPEF